MEGKKNEPFGILKPKKSNFFNSMWKRPDTELKKSNCLQIKFTTFNEVNTNCIIGVFTRLKYQTELQTSTSQPNPQVKEPVPKQTNTKNKKTSGSSQRDVTAGDFYKALGEVYQDMCFSVIIIKPKQKTDKNHFVQLMSKEGRKCVCFSFGSWTYIVMANCDRDIK